MALGSFCPGSIGIRQPKPEYEHCPNCGYEVEIWSDEVRRRCPNCHTPVFKDRKVSCIDWCQYARECVGPEVFERLKKG